MRRERVASRWCAFGHHIEVHQRTTRYNAMRRVPNSLLGWIFAAGIATACNPSNNNTDTGPVSDIGNPNTDATTLPDMGRVMLPDGNTVPITAGTCDTPLDLATLAMHEGMNTVYHGSTVGAPNNLHPAGG